MKTMTSQPEPQSTERHNARLTKRALAFLLDYLVILAYIAALAAVTLGVNWVFGWLGYPIAFPKNPLLADLIAFTTLILPVILYFSLLESSQAGATWGKRKMGIRVVNASGDTLTRRQALVRSLVKLLPWQIAHTCLFHIPGWPIAPAQPEAWVLAGFAVVYILVGFYLLSALLSKDNRSPYDWAAGSYVVDRYR